MTFHSLHGSLRYRPEIVTVFDVWSHKQPCLEVRRAHDHSILRNDCRRGNDAVMVGAGCVLPVELWFLESELPTPGLRRALESMGVAIRLLPAAVAGMSGFAMKGATLLLSGFEEVPSDTTSTFLLQYLYELHVQGGT